MRLDQERKTQKCEQRREIGKREKVIWRATGSASRVPGLQQRTGGAQQDKWQADGKREESQNAPGGIDLRVRTPEHLRSDGQPQETDEKKAQVNGGLAFWREAASSYVRIEIAQKQRGLKKDEARGPNRRRASEPRKNQFGEQRLDQEEKKRAEKDRRCEQQPVQRRHRIARGDGMAFFIALNCICGKCFHDGGFSGSACVEGRNLASWLEGSFWNQERTRKRR